MQNWVMVHNNNYGKKIFNNQNNISYQDARILSAFFYVALSILNLHLRSSQK